MNKMNLDETIEFKMHVKKYIHDMSVGTVNDYPPLLRAAKHHFKRIMELTGYEDSEELNNILNPFIEDENGSWMSYKYYFDKLREKGIEIMYDDEMGRAIRERRRSRRGHNGDWT